MKPMDIRSSRWPGRQFQRKLHSDNRRSRLGTLQVASVLAAAMLMSPCADAGQLLRVGPQRALQTLAMAASVARNGDTLEVDAADYVADVAVWTQDDLTIRSVGGRARLIASGRSAEGKAIWVVRGGTITVEGFDFIGARVPSRNGAGIRFESGRLVVRDCIFSDNENGILTASDPLSELTVENSEFGYNGFGDGYSHNLYVGRIRKLSVTGSYFHHARVGHLLKSRAAENHIFYNRLTDENGGRASYELEFPNGGLAYVVGNVIQQGARTENRVMISFGAEGYAWDRNALYLVGNTLVDDFPQQGSFLFVRQGDRVLKAIDNRLVGSGLLETRVAGEYRNNVHVSRDVFLDADRQDFRLRRPDSLALSGNSEDPGSADGVRLRPLREYFHPRQTRALGHGAQ